MFIQKMKKRMKFVFQETNSLAPLTLTTCILFYKLEILPLILRYDTVGFLSQIRHYYE